MRTVACYQGRRVVALNCVCALRALFVSTGQLIVTCLEVPVSQVPLSDSTFRCASRSVRVCLFYRSKSWETQVWHRELKQRLGSSNWCFSTLVAPPSNSRSRPSTDTPTHCLLNSSTNFLTWSTLEKPFTSTEAREPLNGFLKFTGKTLLCLPQKGQPFVVQRWRL